MPFQRRTDGLGALATTLLIVQDDGTTLEDIGSAGDLTWTENGTLARGQANWNGQARNYFQSLGTTNYLDFTGGGSVNGDTNDPNGSTIFMAIALGPRTGPESGTFIRSSDFGSIGNLKRVPGNQIANYKGGSSGTIQMLGTKTYTAEDFSQNIAVGCVHTPEGSGATPYNNLYLFTDLENGTETAFEANYTDNVNDVAISALSQLGYVPGGWSTQDTRVFCLAIFRNTQLTPAQLGALRDDWFTELIQSPGPNVTEVATGTPTDTELQNSQFRALNGGPGGTYWSRIFPGTVTPDHATIVAGTGAVGNLETGSVDTADETKTVNHSGLTASTAYTRAATIEDSSNQPSTPTYANFSTGAPAVHLRDTIFDVATGVDIPAGRTVEYAFWPAGSLATIGAPAAQGTTTTLDPAGGYNIDVDVSGIFADTDEVTVMYREVVAGGTPPGSNDNWGSGSPVAAVLVFV